MVGKVSNPIRIPARAYSKKLYPYISIALKHMNNLINKLLQYLLLIWVALFASSAMAWFFFIPGSLTGAIADAITGEEGFHCVARSVQVGDRIKTGTGPGIVKSLSGESSRCSTNLNKPIRALLIPAEDLPTPTAKTVESKDPIVKEKASSNAQLELSDEWQQRPLVAGQDPKVVVLYAVNKTTNTALTLGTIKRSELGQVSVFAQTRQATLASNLTDPKLSSIESLRVGQLPAWRYTVTGNSKRGNQISWTYMVTIYEGRDEVIIVNTWTTSVNFELQQAEMHKIENGLSGVIPPQVI